MRARSLSDAPRPHKGHGPAHREAHLALDEVGSVALAATPFLTGQYRRGTRQWLPHVALCVAELSSLLITDPTGRGDYHGNLEAVQKANSIDPDSKLRNGGPAVRRAAAAS